MKKIIVIGCPGSGKSCFSRELSKKSGLPLYHLDMMYWNTDRTTVEREVFLDRLSSAMSADEWIIDGNYASTMEMRMAACDTVFFLDYPLEVCLEGVRQRRGKPRSDMPWIEEGEDAEFVKFIEGFAQTARPRIIELLEKYNDKRIIVFKSRAEADSYLNGDLI